MKLIKESGDRYSWEGFNSEREEFRRLDLERWISKEKVREEGTKQGQSNLPSSNATVLDATENKILDAFNEQINVTREKVNQHLSDLVQDGLLIEDSEDLRNIQRKTENLEFEALTAVEHKYHTEWNALEPKLYELQRAREDFADFRREQGLTRIADYSHRKWALWIIGVCFVIESFLNATLLMEVNVFGLVGSMAQMALISALNVLILSFLISSQWRRTNLRSTPRRVLAWVVIGIVLAFTLTFNLLIGHLRDGMEAVVNDPTFDFQELGALIMQNFTSAPFDLGFQSLLLAILGIAFFGVASWKWLQRDDPYPDYGNRDRQLRILESSYHEDASKSEQRLRREFEELKSKFDDELDKLDINKGNLKTLKNRGLKIIDDYRHFVPECQHDLEYVLSVYREANRDARTEPAPPHFDRQEKIDESSYKPPLFDLPELNPIEEATTRLQEAIKKLQEAYRNYLQRLQRARESKGNEELGRS